ncbi:MAG: hypothetical protein O7A68_07720 [Alphaproteobacteria bacterium]|nr:hypothetical protein [Alphaproteobacteria bacterium]
MTHEPLQKIPSVPEIAAAIEPRPAPPEPDLVNVLVELGDRFRDLGLAPLALAAYRLSLAANPECGGAERAARELEDGGQSLRPLAAAARAPQMLGFLRSVEGIWPEFPELVNGLGLALCEAGRQGHALAVYREALEFNPAYMPSLRPLFYRLVKGADIGRLIAALDQISRRFESFDLGLLFQYGRDELEHAERRLMGARERGLPGLLFNTMPKSASMFIAHSLSRSLDAPLVPIAITTATLRDHVVPHWAEALARGGAV